MSDLVFITGGSGHIGCRVIISALQAGYSVRAAVRSSSKATLILATPSIQALNPESKLTFVIVPDLLVDGAYDDAIKGAAYAIHVASPLATPLEEGENYHTKLIQPAVKGTVNMLEAAKKYGGVKRVVITSSVGGIAFWKDLHEWPAETVVTEKTRAKNIPEPYTMDVEAYSAGKIAALNETEAWMKREKGNISFDVVNIFPSFVLGRDELATSPTEALKGTNLLVLGPVLGEKVDLPLVGSSVDVRDVALAHVKALDPKVPGNQGYLLTAGGLEGRPLEDVFEIVARNFPDAVKAGVLPNNARIASKPRKFDAAASEKALGMKYIDFEEQVKDVIGHYIELVAAAKKNSA
ncbi:hypothetical protein HBH68_184670 [Parastagonospora nodorum]|nr:hypothetical protein HBH68_184670 [Parastagonospora nodorum]KAH6109234.1 hypothetical protein HBI69_160370 [Parastagonospora nodorum]